MSIEQLNLAFKSDIKKSSLKFILVALADYANEVGEAYPSVETIHNKTSLNRKTIITGLHELAKLGYLEDTGKKVGRTKSITVWQITLNSKQSQKRTPSVSSPKNGTGSYPKNGTAKQSQKRDIEPSVLLTTIEPPVKESTKELVLVIPDEINLTSWNEFMEHRGSGKKKPSKLAKTKLINILKKYTPEEQQYLIDYSIAGGYPSIYENQLEKRNGSQRNQSTSRSLTGAAARSADFHEDLKRFATGMDSQTVQQTTDTLYPPMDKLIPHH